MRGVSSKKRSGHRLASMLMGKQKFKNADYIEYTGGKLTAWEGAEREDRQDDLIATSAELVGEG